MDSSSSPPTAANNPAGISLAPEESPLERHGDQFTRLVWAVVLLGIGCRILRYLLRFPLWGDECMLAENIIVRTPAGLWEPLDNGQVAPVGYTEALWIVTRLCGFNEWSLRFIALVAGIFGVVAMRPFALRLLAPLPAILSLTLLSISYYPVRHAAEVKPYALDLAWSVVLLLLADAWRRDPARYRSFLLLLFLTPLAQFTSFTATFVAGGLCIGLALQALLRRSWSQFLAAALYGIVLTAAFAAIYLSMATSQFEVHGEKMQTYWKDSFPPSPISQPLAWIAWMIGTHAGEMFAYPFGGNFGGSTLTLLLSLVGLFWLARRREWWFLATCAGIFALGYLAAALHRYPYGNTSRLVQHLAPLICIFTGCGIASLIELSKSVKRRTSLAYFTVALLCILTVGSSVRDIIVPYKIPPYDQIHRGMARWFWDPKRDPTDLYCVQSDFGHDFWPGTWHSLYLCYQHIESPRHPLDKPRIRVADLPADRPLNVVVYHEPRNEQKGELWDRWWSEMTARFNHADTIDHRVLIDKVGRSTIYGIYRVYRFEPKPQSR